MPRWKTWGDFKKAVEALGVKDDEEIIYIDVAPLGEVHAEYEEPSAGQRGGWRID